MDLTFASILLAGFLMGIKHAVEPDHVIAVSTIATQSKSLRRASLAGVFWGIGHTSTLFVFGMIMLLLKNEIGEGWAMSLEFFVGVMLVVLGARSLLPRFFSYRETASTAPDAKTASGPRLFLQSSVVGFIHGMAGSAALFVLTMATVDGLLEGAAYLLVFGAGTIVGMLLCTTVIGLPFVWSGRRPRLHQQLSGLTGAVSLCFGLWYMYGIGVTDGLFSLWLS